MDKNFEMFFVDFFFWLLGCGCVFVKFFILYFLVWRFCGNMRGNVVVGDVMVVM